MRLLNKYILKKEGTIKAAYSFSSLYSTIKFYHTKDLFDF
ncbi:18397_t:CDS:2 [Gigaspora rosea]|nr:18397_t:CDS:2 [Gigaspora rosea]